MKLTQKLPVARLLAEGLVIVVGVLVALGVDRWVTTLDERTQEESAIRQLVENLVADSAQIVEMIAIAEQRGSLALQILEGSVGEDLAPVEFLASLERIAWWAPLEYSRETWDDLVTTGRLSFIRDDGLRRGLSGYYNRIEWLAQLEVDWDAQLEDYESNARSLLPPLKRFQVLGRIPESATTGSVTQDDMGDVLRFVREDPALSTDLGQVFLVYGSQVDMYGALMRDVATLLSLLRGAL